MADRPDPAQLAEAVKDLSDEDVNSAINEMGLDMVLKEIFTGMQERFLPEKTQGVASVVQYDIQSDDGVKTWHARYSPEGATTGEGPADSPRLTLQIGLVDFVRLIFGQAQGPQLFMSGKLRMQGDMMFAMQMEGFFNRDF